MLFSVLRWDTYRLASCSKTEGRRKRKDLLATVEVVKGMKVMVTNNVETDLDVTNGARGAIMGIVLHPDKAPIGDKSEVTLKYLPAYILIKLGQTQVTPLEGLEDSSPLFQSRLHLHLCKSR